MWVTAAMALLNNNRGQQAPAAPAAPAVDPMLLPISILAAAVLIVVALK